MSKRPLPQDGATSAWKRPRMDSEPVQVGGQTREISSVFDLSLMLYINGFYIQGMLCQFAQTLPIDLRGTNPSPEQVSASVSAFIKSEWQMGKIPLLKRGFSRPAVRYVLPVAAEEMSDFHDADVEKPLTGFQRSADGRYGVHYAKHVGVGDGASVMHTTDKVPLLPTPRLQPSASEKAEGMSLESTAQAARMSIPVVTSKMSPQGFKQVLLTSSAASPAAPTTSSRVPTSRNSATEHANCSSTDAHVGLNCAGNRPLSRYTSHDSGQCNKPEVATPREKTHLRPTGGVPARPRLTEPDSQHRGHRFSETNSQNSCQRLTETNSQNSNQQLAEPKSQNSSQLASSYPLEQFAESTEKIGSRDKRFSAGCPRAQVTGNQQAPSAMDAGTAGARDPTKLSPPSVGLDSSKMAAGHQQNYRGWYTAVIPPKARKNQASAVETNAGQHPRAQSTSDQSLDASDSHKFETTFGKSHVTSTQVTFWQATSDKAQETSDKSQVTSTARRGTNSGQSLTTSGQLQATPTGQLQVNSAADTRATSDTAQTRQRQTRGISEQPPVTLEQSQESSATCDISKVKLEPSLSSSMTSSTEATTAKPSSSQVTFEQWQETVRRIQESVQKLHQMQAQRQSKGSASNTSSSHRRSSVKDRTESVAKSAKSAKASSSSSSSVSSSSSSRVTSEVRPYKITTRDPRIMSHNKPKGFVRPIQQQQQHKTDPRDSVTENATRMAADLPVSEFSSAAKKQRSSSKKPHVTCSRYSREATRVPMTDHPKTRHDTVSSSRKVTRGTDCRQDFARKIPTKDFVIERSEVSIQTEACEMTLPVFTTAGRSTLMDRVTFTEVGTMTSRLNVKKDDHGTMTERLSASDQQTMTTKPLTRDISTVPDTPLTLDMYTMTEPRRDVTTMTSLREIATGDSVSRRPEITHVAKSEVTQVCKIVTPLVTQANTAKAVPAVCELAGWHGVEREKDSNSVPLGIEISQSPGPQCVSARTLRIPAAGEGGGTVRVILRVKTRSSRFGATDLKQQSYNVGGLIA